MAAFQVVDEFANFLGRARNNLATDTFAAVLTLTAPTKAGTQVLTDLVQISGAGGYAPVTLTGVTWLETGAGTGVWEFSSNPFAWTATGADFSSARYVAIYNVTSTNDDVVGFVDYGSAFVVTDGVTFTVTPGVDGIFQASVL